MEESLLIISQRQRIVTDSQTTHPKPRNPMLVRLRKNPRHHIHLRHTLTDTRQPIHRRILRTHNRKRSHQSHPDLTHTAKKIFPVKQDAAPENPSAPAMEYNYETQTP